MTTRLLSAVLHLSIFAAVCTQAATNPTAPSGQLERLLDPCLDAILAPLEENPKMPRIEVEKLRSSFAGDQIKAKTPAQQQIYQNAMAVCAALTSAMDDRAKAKSDAQASAKAPSVANGSGIIKSAPMTRGRNAGANAEAIRQKQNDERQYADNLAHEQSAFVASGAYKAWTEKSAHLRQSVMALYTRQIQLEALDEKNMPHGDVAEQSKPKSPAPEPAVAPVQEPEKAGGNLFTNPNFENEADGWELVAFGKKGTMSVDKKELHNGKPSLRIDNPEGGLTFVKQKVEGKPNTHYQLSGYIMTKDVEPEKNGSKDWGACLMVGFTAEVRVGQTQSKARGGKSVSTQKTKPWTKITVDFTSGTKTDLPVGAALGYYNENVTGTAWFSELALTELGGKPTTEPLPEAGRFIDQFFVSKTWQSSAGTSYAFSKDGTCLRQAGHSSEKMLWHELGNGIVEVTGKDKRDTRYFRFLSATEAYYNGDKNDINKPINLK